MVEISILRADTGDAAEILELQILAYQSEAQLYQNWSIAPLTQTLGSLLEEFSGSTFLKATYEGQIVGSVRASLAEDVCHIGRLMVHPNFQRSGIGSLLLRAIEEQFPAAAKYELFTGSLSNANIRLYEGHGYAVHREQSPLPTLTLVFMEKKARSTTLD